MVKVKSKKTREQKLAQARLHKKQKYEQLKKDPAKYAKQKEKERLRYLKRKEKKKIKTIQDMTPRQQRVQRKKWRENSKKRTERVKRSKQIEQMLLDNTPPTSDLEDDRPKQKECDPLEGPSSIAQNEQERNISCTDCVKWKRKLRRIRYIYTKKIGSLKNKLEQEKLKKNKIHSKLNKLLENNKKSQKENLSTGKKAEALINSVNESKKKEVKRRLIFGDVLTRQLKQGYEALNKKDKRSFSNIIVKDKEKFRKHKILHAASSFSLRTKKEVEKRTGKYIIQAITDFFEDDSNSRIAADKKEYVKRAGITKQKRYISDTLINLHKKFLKTHSCEVGYSTFCKNRPFWVVYPKESNRNTCSCIVHVNMDLLIKSLNTNKIIKETNGSAVLQSLCCDIHQENCLNRTCKTCSQRVIQYGEFSNDKCMNYYQWVTNKVKYELNGSEKYSKKTTKMKFEDTPHNLIEKLENSLTPYLKHCLNINQQYKNINDLKMSLAPKEVLVHMDFSENYTTKFHEEVQSRHFGSSPEQITLHTSVVYLLDPETGLSKSYSMCTVSECTRHDAEAIWAHVIAILEYVKEITGFDTIHFVTDSPSSQYRNRKIFYVVSQLQHQFPELKSISWNYLESGHGKGAPDGIGAVIKRTADSAVCFGTDVGTLKDFWYILKQKIKNVEIRLVTTSNIEDKKIPQKTKTFKGTMSVHQVLWSSDNYRMTFRKLSCFFCQNGIECAHGYHLGYMNIPDDNMIEPKEHFLQDFLEENTTPEIIKDLMCFSNPLPSTSQASFDLVEPLQAVEINKTEDVSRKARNSPKVKILSDVRLDWTNIPFYINAKSTPNDNNYQSDFERFIVSPLKADGDESNNVGVSKKVERNYDNYKENKGFFDDSDSSLDIF
ncbi:uncharacterized protein LOC123874272 [Maniola jurtina]|uniref:uncharacterized protein LOC123874272 n=1 Tax=Maniola jurtina TaxID=191418 RepID=UPI001E68A065|nr:uncharacterized protein LOC123874272 [Maniola jurtina]